MNVGRIPLQFNAVPNSAIDKTFLPNYSVHSQQLAGLIRKATFDELHRPLQGRTFQHSKNQMKMIGHDDESVNLKLVRVPVMKEGFAKRAVPFDPTAAGSA